MFAIAMRRLFVLPGADHEAATLNHVNRDGITTKTENTYGASAIRNDARGAGPRDKLPRLFSLLVSFAAPDASRQVLISGRD